MDPAFDLLADIVASDRLMVFTGSGISQGLENEANEKLPGWAKLLREVVKEVELGDAERRDVEALLRGTKGSAPTGQELIEAASILAKRDEEAFDRELVRLLTPAEKQRTDVEAKQRRRHGAVLDLQPRGIVTLNIDGRHRRVLKTAGTLEAWCEINPLLADSEEKARGWLRDQSRPLLVEAHGSIDHPEAGYVFTHRAYRELMQKNPAYRALLRYLLGEYHFVFVGFGLTDLDFDQFLHELSMDFDAPLREHVVVRKAKKTAAVRRQEVRYRRRFGIHALDVESYEDVWTVLEQARTHRGPRLLESLRLCFDRDPAERHRGHLRLTELGPAGRAMATVELCSAIVAGGDTHRVTEAIYALGYLRYAADEPARGEAKEALFAELEAPVDTERLAHALSAIEPFLGEGDLERLERAAATIRRATLPSPRGYPDPDRRCPVYAEALVLRLRAKHETWPPRPFPPLVDDGG